MVFAVTSIAFMQLALAKDGVTVMEDGEALIFVSLGSFNLILWASQVFSEVLQLIGMEHKISYLMSVWNWVYIFGLTSVFLIIIITMGTELSLQPETYILGSLFSFASHMIDLETLRVMAAVASFCLLAEFFDWLRLFEQTAFYITLVIETLNDIRAFIILIIASLMLFGVPMVMLDLNRDDGNLNIEPIFGSWSANMFLNQYFLALGEFNYGNFATHPQGVLCYLLFLGATFYTQITMLNMLIAIMGDSFARVFENRDVTATKTKLNFMHDMAGTVGKRSSSEEENVFMFIVKPEETEMLHDEEWEGNVNRITSTI